jgi:hypothetical protein
MLKKNSLQRFLFFFLPSLNFQGELMAVKRETEKKKKKPGVGVV